MTSEPDNTSGRRPPTIELTATEVEASASAPGAGATGSTGEQSANATADRDTSRAGNRTSGRATSHALSAAIGAVAMAAIVAGLWIAGVVPPHEAPAPAETPAATPLAANSRAEQAISARLDRIERTIQAIQTQKPDPAQANRLAAVEAQAKTLGDSITALTRRLDDVAATSKSAAKQADAAQAEAAEAAKTANEANSRSAVDPSENRALAEQIAAIKSGLQVLADNAAHPATSANDPAARLTIAAEALRATVERGAPYQAELAAVVALGVDKAKIAPLEPFAATGVPSAVMLAHELAALVPALRHSSETASGTITFLGRLESGAQHLVRVTPVDAPAGNDPAAIVGRIEADAAHADLAAAETDIAALPPSAQAPAADWLAKVKARDAAIAASRQIAADALAALNKPGTQ